MATVSSALVSEDWKLIKYKTKSVEIRLNFVCDRIYMSSKNVRQ
jgi:hypothetical protein